MATMGDSAALPFPTPIHFIVGKEPDLEKHVDIGEIIFCWLPSIPSTLSRFRRDLNAHVIEIVQLENYFIYD